MTKKQEKEERKQEAIRYLKSMIKPGDTVYTTLKHVSRSGMYRVIELFISHNDRIVNITGQAAIALDDKYDQRHYGIGVGGCGMDMGFHLVYNLSYVLFKGGFQCAGEKCTCNDHHNPPYPPKDGKTFHAGDSGYAISQSWM